MVQSSDRIKVIEGDIVKLEVDAVVNAANSTLLGGGGVDGAIHRAAGPGLLEECRTLNGCPTGKAKITKGYLLPVKWVIHTVGPIWRGGREGEENLLASCYRESLEIAREYSVKTIAFPAISTGAYSFPSERAAEIAVSEIRNFIQGNDLPETIFLSVSMKKHAGIFGKQSRKALEIKSYIEHLFIFYYVVSHLLGYLCISFKKHY